MSLNAVCWNRDIKPILILFLWLNDAKYCNIHGFQWLFLFLVLLLSDMIIHGMSISIIISIFLLLAIIVILCKIALIECLGSIVENRCTMNHLACKGKNWMH